MIKRTQHVLKYQNSGKTEWLNKLFADYKELHRGAYNPSTEKMSNHYCLNHFRILNEI
jgi:hypothetical protein